MDSDGTLCCCGFAQPRESLLGGLPDFVRVSRKAGAAGSNQLELLRKYGLPRFRRTRRVVAHYQRDEIDVCDPGHGRSVTCEFYCSAGAADQNSVLLVEVPGEGIEQTGSSGA